jgi:hypothetical protein
VIFLSATDDEAVAAFQLCAARRHHPVLSLRMRRPRRPRAAEPKDHLMVATFRPRRWDWIPLQVI